MMLDTCLYMILGATVLFGWPALASELIKDDTWLSNAIANQTLMLIAPLYIMVCIRSYWQREPVVFHLNRYAECL
jgi:hypothetical protein